MGKKKELSVLDYPRRRSRRLMKLNADVNPAENFHQQPDSSSIDLLSVKVTYDEAVAGNGDDDNLEALAKDVFKNMKVMLVSSPEDFTEPAAATVEHQSELLPLETIKMPSKKIQV